MFDTPRYIQNSFNVVFPRHATIRRLANDFEDRLKGRYLQPQIIGVPDELDPEVPRMIFGSVHGFSQIVVSQVGIVLNVTYSPEYQADSNKGKSYLAERIAILFDLITLLGEKSPYFCGLSTKVQLPCKGGNEEVLAHLAKLLLKNESTASVHDLNLRTTSVVDNLFFSNLGVANYRTWDVAPNVQGVTSLSYKDALEYGVEITADFNDRYSYNEDKNYRSTLEQAKIILKSGFSQVKRAIEMIGGMPS